jgi:molybdopterin-biosynthesis enzyme MoeA-like protein
VSDDITEIALAIQEAIQRKPLFVITTGGLGPTFDDKTLEGLAKALGRKTEVNQTALKMVKEKYVSYATEGRMDAAKLTPARVKMATLPERTTPVRNPTGTAPAVKVKHQNVTLFTLPGVPTEMKSIFDDSVAPLIRQAAKGVTFFEASITATDVMESAIAPFIDKVMKNNPHVYIKSHPQGTERVPIIEFHFSTTAKNKTEARNRVSKAIVQLTEFVNKKGGTAVPVKFEN